MFLVDSAEATADWEGVTATIKNILEKAKAEIVLIKKWDDRKLAYEINGKGKGVYILCYFRAEGSRLRDIERDIQLSEQIMRALILCAEQRRAEDIENDFISQKNSEVEAQKDTHVAQAEKSRQETGQKRDEAEPEQMEQKETDGFEPVV
jgi:small subunit ribosomal protein S6